MRNPFALLGLQRDADEPAIKRAYAQRLRHNRPDEDPVAFQALNDAYRRCLEIAASRGDWKDEDDYEEPPYPEAAGESAAPLPGGDWNAAGDADAPHYGESAPGDDDGDGETPRFVRLSFDVDAFLHELQERAQRDPPHRLESWLRGLEPLYSLELKHALRAPAASMVANADPLPPPHALRLIMQFFDLDGVSSDDDWLRRQLRERLREAQEAQALDEEIARYRSPREKAVDRLLMRELLGPRNSWRRGFLLLVPLLPSRLISLLDLLQHDYPSAVDERVSQESVRYWRRAADRTRLDWRRLMVTPLRVPFYYGGMAGFVALLTASTGPLQGMAMNCAMLIAALLAWTIAGTLLKRVNAYFERERGWNPSLLHVIALYVGGTVASLWWTAVPVLLFIGIGFAWAYRRPWGPYWLASATMIAGAVAAYAVGMAVQGGGEAKEAVWVAASGWSSGSLVLHDAVYAWRKRISLDAARMGMGWLGWLFVAQLLLATTLPAWIALLHR